MNNYINEYFDTGFLTPRINFILFCGTLALAAVGIIEYIILGLGA